MSLPELLVDLALGDDSDLVVAIVEIEDELPD